MKSTVTLSYSSVDRGFYVRLDENGVTVREKFFKSEMKQDHL